MKDIKSRLGFRQLPSDKDRNFPLSALLAADEEPRLALKIFKHGPIMDQGNVGACVGHGCQLALTSDPVRQKGANPFTIWRRAREIDEFEDTETDGTSVRAGCDVLKAMGFIKSYHWADNTNEINRYILGTKSRRGSTIVVGTPWLSKMNSPRDGVVTIGGTEEGGHCYLIIGVDLTKGIYICANSWGLSYGKGGLFSVSIKQWAPLLKDGCAAALVEAA